MNQGNSVFRASTICSKILNAKKYFKTVKNSRATVFFRASASCSKTLNDKKDILNTVKNSRANSVSQDKRKLLKNSECKGIFHTVKIFRATLFFRASASCSKILNVKSIFNTVKNSRASASCSKILNDKICFNTVKNFRANSVFQDKRKLLKNSE